MKTLNLTNKELNVIYHRLNAQNSLFTNYYIKEGDKVIQVSQDKTRVTDDLFEKVKRLK